MRIRSLQKKPYRFSLTHFMAIPGIFTFPMSLVSRQGRWTRGVRGGHGRPWLRTVNVLKILQSAIAIASWRKGRKKREIKFLGFKL